jgi:hypothetical protein
MSDRLIRDEDTVRALEAGRFPRLVMVRNLGRRAAPPARRERESAYARLFRLVDDRAGRSLTPGGS